MPEAGPDDFANQFRALIDAQNHAGQERFDGLSAAQMNQLLYHPLSAGSVVQWAEHISEADAAGCFFVQAVDELLDRLATADLKLTTKGNLPLKVVNDWYGRFVARYGKSTYAPDQCRSEDDWPLVTAVRMLTDELGWTKQRSGKLSLTKRGKKIRQASAAERLRLLFEIAPGAFNFEYHAKAYRFGAAPEGGILQQFTGFVLYQLIRRGERWRPVSDYCERFRTAFPTLLATFDFEERLGAEIQLDRTYERTFLETMLHWFGLVKLRNDDPAGPDGPPAEMMATDRFRRLFRLVPDAKRPEQPGDVDTQIRTALFDAEMGSQSWMDNDTPVELQEAFHARVRAFHDADDPTGRTRIGDLMKDLPQPDPDQVTDQQQALGLINELLEQLASRHVFFPPPPHLDPVTLYRFLVTDLYAHEIPPPTEQYPALVPFESVATDLPDFDPFSALTEVFVGSMLHLDHALDPGIFAAEMRLHHEIAPRAAALRHAEDWRAQWTSVVPISFGPGERHSEDDHFVYQFFGVEYEGVRPDGSREKFGGAGLVQFVPGPEGQPLVYGAHFPGFEF